MSHPPRPGWVDPFSPHVWADKEIPNYHTLNLYLRDYGDYLLQPQMCKVHATVAQSIPNTTWTVVQFGTEDLDNNDMWSGGGEIYARTAGWYVGAGSVCYDESGSLTGRRRQTIWASRVNSYIAESQDGAGSGAVAGRRISVSFGPIWMNANNYIQLRCYQTSGAAVNTKVGTLEYDSDLFIRWIGPQ